MEGKVNVFKGCILPLITVGIMIWFFVGYF
jgi:hypothetical protein